MAKSLLMTHSDLSPCPTSFAHGSVFSFLMLRVQIALNDGRTKPQAQRVMMVSPSGLAGTLPYAVMRDNVKRKMGFKRQPRVFHTDGIEWANDSVVYNGMMVIADEAGRDFRGARRADVVCATPNFVAPPRANVFNAFRRSHTGYQALAPLVVAGVAAVGVDAGHHSELRAGGPSLPPVQLKGRFPVLEGDVRAWVRHVADVHPIIIHCTVPLPGVEAFDYVTDAQFPPYDGTPHTATLYECRGLWVSATSGRVLARRLHKFFEGALPVDAVAMHRKYDGTLVTPVLLDDGRVVWATRTYAIQYTNPALEAVLLPYLRAGQTVMFEFCTDTRPVGVLVYDACMLVLIARRDNTTGAYLSTAELADAVMPLGIRVAEPVAAVDAPGTAGVEGVVVTCADGNMVKVKTRWYMDVVRSRLMKDPVRWLHDRGHGQLPDTMRYVPDGDLRARQLFVDLVAWREYALDKGLSVRDVDDQLRQYWGVGHPCDADTVTAVLNSFIQRGERVLVEALLADRLLPETAPSPLVTACTAEVRDHVLGVYLPRKLEKLGDGATVELMYGYGPSEGKLFGLHEGVAYKHGLIDLRVDLQPALAQATAHNGDNDYGLLLVQCERATGQHITLAGVFVPVNVRYTLDMVVDAMRSSFDSQELVTLSRTAVTGGVDSDDEKERPPEHEQERATRLVYCDLDGVLVDLPSIADGRRADVDFSVLPPMSYGADLWARICAVAGQTPTILTAVSRTATKKRHKEIAAQKRQWVATHLGDDVVVITCAAGDKHLHVAPGAILIDDNDHPRWRECGGVLIRHVSPARTVFELTAALDSQWWRKAVESQRLAAVPPSITPGSVVWVPAGTAEKPAGLDGVTAVGFDAEWDFTSADGVEIVQLATPAGVVYVVDVAGGVPAWMIQLLENDGVTKACYDLSCSDIDRLRVTVRNVFDLRADVRHGGAGGAGAGGGLAEVASTILALACPPGASEFVKNKAMTLSDWSTRPLSSAQLQYAAADAAILLCLHRVLGSPPGANVAGAGAKAARHGGGAVAIQSATEVREGDACSVEYWAYVLDVDSSRMLRRAFPPVHACRGADCYDHVTTPHALELTGRPVQLVVTAACTTADVQAVRVAGGDPEYDDAHVTLSYAPHATAKDVGAVPVTAWTDLPTRLTVSGTPCAFVRSLVSPLASLSEAVQRKVDRFERCDADKVLTFQAADLTSEQRALVHEYALRTGLRSASHGVDTHRRLTLTKTKSRRPKPGTAKYDRLFEQKTHRVFDVALFKSLKLHQAPSGHVGKHGVITPAIATLVTAARAGEAVVVIMRGLPGTGKTTVAHALASEPRAVMSADDFFGGGAGGGAQTTETLDIEHAHAQCEGALEALLEAPTPPRVVVVDNTSACHWMYARYVRVAQSHSRRVVVVELQCPSAHAALAYARRSVHGVGVDAVMGMYYSWQRDDDAIVVAPYLPTSPDVATAPTLAAWLKAACVPLAMTPTPSTTHMIVGVGTSPRYISIANHLMPGFLECYVQCTEKKWLCELIQREPFAFFADIDDLGTRHSWRDVGVFLSETLGLADVLIVAAHPQANRGHVYTTTPTSREGALRLCEAIRAAGLVAAVDTEVYGSTGGLRMPGSSKLVHGVDSGREYVCAVFWAGDDASVTSLADILPRARINLAL